MGIMFRGLEGFSSEEDWNSYQADAARSL
jgi:hypothetical protein